MLQMLWWLLLGDVGAAFDDCPVSSDRRVLDGTANGTCVTPELMFCLPFSTSQCDGDFHSFVAAPNPFGVSPDTPTLVDFKGDGKSDFVYIDSGKALHLLRNEGTHAAPAFAEIPGVFATVTADYERDKPTFCDLTGDGLPDLILAGGLNNQAVAFYQNTGTPSLPAFSQRTGADNPFDALNPRGRIMQVKSMCHDVNGDGLQDFVWVTVGNPGTDCRLEVYGNSGNATHPAFSNISRADSDNPLSASEIGDVGEYCSPALHE